MLWPLASPFDSNLPLHCEPTNDFLLRFSALFHTCIPTPLAFVSNTLGILSIIAWLFSQLPQIYKNWKDSSTSGLSFFFLLEWCLGDLSNLLGAIFTHQALWQIEIGSYYVFVDICLVGQWIWYEKLRHGREVRSVWPSKKRAPDDWSEDGMHGIIIEGISLPSSRRSSGCEDSRQSNKKLDKKLREPTQPQIIFRTPDFQRESGREHRIQSSVARGNTVQLSGSSPPMYSPSPRTLLLVACLAAIVSASPMSKPLEPPVKDIDIPLRPLESAGTILAWTSTVLYLGSRLPQLIKNWRRKSTAGLSPQLFAAAFCGNLFYSLALATNPSAWYNLDSYGEGGWVGSDGSDRAEWVRAALPFFLGAAGVLLLDASVGVQFMMYGENDSAVLIVEEQGGKKSRWRRVSGWMRGWIPSIARRKSGECAILIEADDPHSNSYGTMS